MIRSIIPDQNLASYPIQHDGMMRIKRRLLSAFADMIALSLYLNHNGIPSINSIAPSRPTVIIASPSVLVAKPASQYVK